MFDEREYNLNLNENEGLIHTIVSANGFTGADHDDVVQQIKLNYWKTRGHPRNGDSEAAYLCGLARKTCAEEKRKERRMMRSGAVFRFEERDTGEVTNGTIDGREIFKSADQERIVDAKRLNEDLTAFAGMMRQTHGKIVLNGLKADEQDVRTPAPKNKIGMLRESRRLLQLPQDNPGTAEVTNPAARLARIVRDAGHRRPSPAAQPKRIIIKRAAKKETACATAPSPTIIKRDNDTTQVQRPTFDLSTESSSPSFGMTSAQRTPAAAPKRAIRSRRAKNVSAPFLPKAGALHAPKPKPAPTSRRRGSPALSPSAPPKDPRSVLPSAAPAAGRTRSGR